MSKSSKSIEVTENIKKSGDFIPQKSRKEGKNARELMNRHISDKNDVITEEEFKNMEIDTTLDSGTAHETLEIRNDPDRPKDEGKDHPIVTPWDVIK
jgi:hypothetical protein